MKKKLFKIIAFFICFSMLFEQSGFAQVAGQLDLSGYIGGLRSSFVQDKFRPLHLRYLAHDNQSNNFKLLLDKGDLKKKNRSELKGATEQLLDYFLVGVSLPNESFWVNLRPDSADNIIDPYLANTDVGKVLLEADLQLKKDTAKATSPETAEGRRYWKELYKKAEELFGYENITIPTLSRPWIVPSEIIIRETPDNAYVYKATLKVMLEQDHLKDSPTYNFKDPRMKALNEYAAGLMRKHIIPKLTKEVNVSKRYAGLRQVYYSLILAQWFKARFYGKRGLYSGLINKRNLSGLTSGEPWTKAFYFQQYQQSFKDGEYNIQEPVRTPFGQTIRTYFSGGIELMASIPQTPPSPGTMQSDEPVLVIGGNPANNSPRLSSGEELDAEGGTQEDLSLQVVSVDEGSTSDAAAGADEIVSAQGDSEAIDEVEGPATPPAAGVSRPGLDVMDDYLPALTQEAMDEARNHPESLQVQIYIRTANTPSEFREEAINRLRLFLARNDPQLNQEIDRIARDLNSTALVARIKESLTRNAAAAYLDRIHHFVTQDKGRAFLPGILAYLSGLGAHIELKATQDIAALRDNIAGQDDPDSGAFAAALTDPNKAWDVHAIISAQEFGIDSAEEGAKFSSKTITYLKAQGIVKIKLSLTRGLWVIPIGQTASGEEWVIRDITSRINQKTLDERATELIAKGWFPELKYAKQGGNVVFLIKYIDGGEAAAQDIQKILGSARPSWMSRFDEHHFNFITDRASKRTYYIDSDAVSRMVTRDLTAQEMDVPGADQSPPTPNQPAAAAAPAATSAAGMFMSEFGVAADEVMDFLGLSASGAGGIASFTEEEIKTDIRFGEAMTYRYKIILSDGTERVFYAKRCGIGQSADQIEDEGRILSIVFNLVIGPKAKTITVNGSPVLISMPAEGEPIYTEDLDDKVAMALGLALGKMHAAGIVHGDLFHYSRNEHFELGTHFRPDHIYIYRDGDGARAIFIDFSLGSLMADDGGISKERDEARSAMPAQLRSIFDKAYTLGFSATQIPPAAAAPSEAEAAVAAEQFLPVVVDAKADEAQIAGKVAEGSSKDVLADISAQADILIAQHSNQAHVEGIGNLVRIGGGADCAVFEIQGNPEYAGLVFKKYFSRQKLESHMEELSKIARGNGCAAVRINGFLLIAADYLAPYNYDLETNMIVQQKASMSNTWQDMRGLQDELEAHNIRSTDLKPENVGVINGKKVIVDSGVPYWFVPQSQLAAAAPLAAAPADGAEVMAGSQAVTSISPDSLPTDSALASEGLRALQALIDSLPENLANRVRTYITGMMWVYAGINPELVLSEYLMQGISQAEREQLIAAIERDGRFIVVGYSRDWADQQAYSLINLEAARRVMLASPDYFPAEALENPAQWLKGNPDKWAASIHTAQPIVQIRYGLLSGFPRSAVEKFAALGAVMSLTQIRSGIRHRFASSEEFDRYKNWLDSGEPASGEEKTELKDILIRVRENLSPEEKQKYDLSDEKIDLLLESRLVRNSVFPGFVGFGEGEETWADQLEAIFNDAVASARSSGEIAFLAQPPAAAVPATPLAAGEAPVMQGTPSVDEGQAQLDQAFADFLGRQPAKLVEACVGFINSHGSSAFMDYIRNKYEENKGNPFKANAVVLTLREVFYKVRIDVEEKDLPFLVEVSLPQVQRALRHIMQQADASGKVILYQNLRLGGMYPVMGEEAQQLLREKGYPVHEIDLDALEQRAAQLGSLQGALGEYLGKNKAALDEARIILARFSISSSPSKLGGSVEPEHEYIPLESQESKLQALDELSKRMGVPLLMLDASSKRYSGAQDLVKKRLPTIARYNPYIDYDEDVPVGFVILDDVKGILPAQRQGSAEGVLHKSFAAAQVQALAADADFWGGAGAAAVMPGNQAAVKISPDALPTDSALAQEGLRALQGLIDSLPENLANRVRTYITGMMWVYTGVNVELGMLFSYLMQGVILEDRELLITAIEKDGRFIVAAYEGQNGQQHYSLINIEAARRVILANPGYFPAEAAQNPGEWLKNNTDEWVVTNMADKPIAHIRYGLLSSYPRSAVEKFSSLGIAKSLNGIKQKFTPAEWDIYYKWLVSGVAASGAEKTELGTILRQVRERLSPEERTRYDLSDEKIDLLLELRRVVNSLFPGFMGFGEGEETWADQLEAIFNDAVASARSSGEIAFLAQPPAAGATETGEGRGPSTLTLPSTAARFGYLPPLLRGWAAAVVEVVEAAIGLWSFVPAHGENQTETELSQRSRGHRAIKIAEVAAIIISIPILGCATTLGFISALGIGLGIALITNIITHGIYNTIAQRTGGAMLEVPDSSAGSGEDRQEPPPPDDGLVYSQAMRLRNGAGKSVRRIGKRTYSGEEISADTAGFAGELLNQGLAQQVTVMNRAFIVETSLNLSEGEIGALINQALDRLGLEGAQRQQALDRLPKETTIFLLDKSSHIWAVNNGLFAINKIIGNVSNPEARAALVRLAVFHGISYQLAGSRPGFEAEQLQRDAQQVYELAAGGADAARELILFLNARLVNNALRDAIAQIARAQIEALFINLREPRNIDNRITRIDRITELDLRNYISTVTHPAQLPSVRTVAQELEHDPRRYAALVEKYQVARPEIEQILQARLGISNYENEVSAGGRAAVKLRLFELLAVNPDLSVSEAVAQVAEEFADILQPEIEKRILPVGTEVEIWRSSPYSDPGAYPLDQIRMMWGELLGLSFGYDELIEFALEPSNTGLMQVKMLDSMVNLGFIPFDPKDPGRMFSLHISVGLPVRVYDRWVNELLSSVASYIELTKAMLYTSDRRLQTFPGMWTALQAKSGSHDVKKVNGKAAADSLYDPDADLLRIEYRSGDVHAQQFYRQAIPFTQVAHNLMFLTLIAALDSPDARIRNRFEKELVKIFDGFVRAVDQWLGEADLPAELRSLFGSNLFNRAPDMRQIVQARRADAEAIQGLANIVENMHKQIDGLSEQASLLSQQEMQEEDYQELGNLEIVQRLREQVPVRVDLGQPLFRPQDIVRVNFDSRVFDYTRRAEDFNIPAREFIQAQPFNDVESYRDFDFFTSARNTLINLPLFAAEASIITLQRNVGALIWAWLRHMAGEIARFFRPDARFERILVASFRREQKRARRAGIEDQRQVNWEALRNVFQQQLMPMDELEKFFNDFEALQRLFGLSGRNVRVVEREALISTLRSMRIRHFVANQPAINITPDIQPPSVGPDSSADNTTLILPSTQARFGHLPPLLRGWVAAVAEAFEAAIGLWSFVPGHGDNQTPEQLSQRSRGHRAIKIASAAAIILSIPILGYATALGFIPALGIGLGTALIANIIAHGIYNTLAQKMGWARLEVPGQSMEGQLPAAAGRGIEVAIKYLVSYDTPSLGLKSDEPTAEEREELLRKMQRVVRHIADVQPAIIVRWLINVGFAVSAEEIKKIDIAYHRSGSNKRVFRVQVQSSRGNKEFLLALKTNRQAQLFEPGELDMLTRLQGTGFVPQLGGVIYIEDIGQGYGEILFEEPQDISGFETLEAEEFIEGFTLEEIAASTEQALNLPEARNIVLGGVASGEEINTIRQRLTEYLLRKSFTPEAAAAAFEGLNILIGMGGDLSVILKNKPFQQLTSIICARASSLMAQAFFALNGEGELTGDFPLDVHWRNIMLESGSGRLVIVDLGKRKTGSGFIAFIAEALIYYSNMPNLSPENAIDSILEVVPPQQRPEVLRRLEQLRDHKVVRGLVGGLFPSDTEVGWLYGVSNRVSEFVKKYLKSHPIPGRQLQLGDITFGYYYNGEIVLDLAKARQALATVMPEVATLPDYKLTGFVHAHEIFHALIATLGINLDAAQEELLANIFAKKVFNIELTAAEQAVWESLSPENQAALENFAVPYEGQDFLINLHRAGIDFSSIRAMEAGEAIPEAAKLMGGENIIPSEHTVLPTDIALAVEGLRDLQSLIDSLPATLAKKVLERIRPMILVYSGIPPESSERFGMLMQHLTAPEREQLIEAIERGGKFIVIHHNMPGAEFYTTGRYGLINLESARRIMQANSDYFPTEAIENPAAWLRENQDKWFPVPFTTEPVVHIRYGLMSGFPRSAAEKHSKLGVGVYLSGIRHRFTAAEWNYYDQLHRKESSDAEKISLRDILRRVKARLSPEESRDYDLTDERIDLIVQSRAVHILDNAFSGYNENDEQWAVELEAIFYNAVAQAGKSGITTSLSPVIAKLFMQPAVSAHAAPAAADISPDSLPTDNALAPEGLRALQGLVDSLPENLASRVRNHIASLMWVYAGINPELSVLAEYLMQGISQAEREQLIAAIERDGRFIVVGYSRDWVDQQGYSLINLEAARRVMLASPDYFPAEALENPAQWLKGNPDKWAASIYTAQPIVQIRYGLLSGFPRSAVEKFAALGAVMSLTQIRSGIRHRFASSEEFDRYKNWLYSGEPASGEEKIELRGILRRVRENLSPEEKQKYDLSDEKIDLLLESRLVRNSVFPGFVGFGQSEEAWASQLEAVFNDAAASARSSGEIAFLAQPDKPGPAVQSPSSPDSGFLGGSPVVDKQPFNSLWQQAAEVAVSEEHLAVIAGPAMGPDFIAPLVRQISRAQMDSIAAGHNVIRQGNQVLVVDAHWQGLSQQEQLDILMHEAMADWHQRMRPGQKIHDAAIDLEGLKVDEAARRLAHQGVKIDRAMEGQDKPPAAAATAAQQTPPPAAGQGAEALGESEAIRPIGAVLADAERLIAERMGTIYEMMDQQIQALPENPSQPQALPQAIEDAYKELFLEIARLGQGIPEFDQLAEAAGRGEFSQRFVMDTLTPLFLGNGKLLLFGQSQVTYQNRRINNMPILNVYNIVHQYTLDINILGKKATSMVLIVEDTDVADYITTRMGRSRIVAAALPSLQINGSIPVMVRWQAAANVLTDHYNKLDYVFKHGQLPQPLSSGDDVIDEVMIRLLEKQWDWNRNEPPIAPQEFWGRFYHNFEMYLVFHEVIHAILPGAGERITYLFEIASTPFKWLRLYEALKDLFVTGPAGFDSHRDAVGFLFWRVLPGIFQGREPGSIAGISEDMHRAAARVDTQGISLGLISAIPLLPEEVINDETFRVARELFDQIHPTATSGQISRGYSQEQVTELIRQNTVNPGAVPEEVSNAVDVAIQSLLRRQAELEGELQALGVLEDEIARAIGAFNNKAFRWFNAVVQDQDHYVLGSNSALAVNIIQYLLRQPNAATLIEEYVLHEALENIPDALLNHYQIIELTQRFFKRPAGWQVTPGAADQARTVLGEVVRGFISENAPAPSQAEAPAAAPQDAATGDKGGIDGSAGSPSIPQDSKKTGGIDFRALPIATQPMGQSPSSRSGQVPSKSLVKELRRDLSRSENEWAEIERMLKAGIKPSADRIKGYVEVCAQKEGFNAEIDKILSCIAGILRLEEQECCLTEPALRQLLALLESQEPFGPALARVQPLPKEPKNKQN